MTANNTQAHEPLQRILLPKRGEPFDVRMLYLIEAEQNRERLSWFNRTSVTIPAGEEASFETYFNAFPASYWRRWSQLRSVILSLDIEGQANISLYRSKQDGQRISVANHLVSTGHHEFELPLKNFEDGGWLWFDITAEKETTLSDAAWCSPQAPAAQTLPDGTELAPSEKRVAVGIPTFNRPTDAVAALEALASDPEVDAVIEALIMPDQGNQHPADQPGFPAMEEHFGDRLRIVDDLRRFLLAAPARAIAAERQFGRDKHSGAHVRGTRSRIADACQIGIHIAGHGLHLEDSDPHRQPSDRIAPRSRRISPNRAIRPKTSAASSTKTTDADAMVGVYP